MTALPVVAVPGTGCDGRLYDTLGPAVPNLLVEMPPEDTIEQMAAGVLDRAPACFVLVGHSFGGYVALLAASMAPERVRGLALVSTSARADGDDVRAARRDVIARTEADFEGTARRLARSTLHEPPTGPHPAQPDVTDMLLRVGSATMLRQLRATYARPPLADAARRLAMPTVVVSGVHDRIVPHQASIELAALVPGARLVALDCGHLPPIEQPEATAAAICSALADASRRAG